MRGIVSKIFDWGAHPTTGKNTTAEWAAGLLVVLILSFLWSTVIKSMAEV